MAGAVVAVAEVESIQWHWAYPMVVVVGPASSSAAARKRQHIILKSVFLIVIIAMFIGFQLGVPLPPPPQFLLSDSQTNFSKSLKGKIIVDSART